MNLIQNLYRLPKIGREAGQSLVEFALVTTFIIIPLTFGLIETSVLLYKYVTLTNAAREGARTGSIYLYIGNPGTTPTLPDAGRSTTVLTTVKNTVGPLIVSPPDCNGTSANTICQISYGTSSALFVDPLRSTELLTVTLTHSHPFLFGAVASSLDLQAQASMRIEPSAVISGTGP